MILMIFCTFWKAAIYQINKIQHPKNGKNNNFRPSRLSKVVFTENLSDRKILKFPHCELWSGNTEKWNEYSLCNEQIQSLQFQIVMNKLWSEIHIMCFRHTNLSVFVEWSTLTYHYQFTLLCSTLKASE